MMLNNQDKIDAINKEIEKYNLQAKKVKNVVPLVTVVTLAAVIFFIRGIDNHTLTSGVGIGSVMVYISTFIYAYYKCASQIKKLKKDLDQLQ